MFRHKFKIVAITGLLVISGAPVWAAEDEPVFTNETGITKQVLRTPALADAPADDFHRVAWCHGILSGHMDMAERIATIEPVSEMMQAIGTSYLRAYEAALTLSDEGKTPEGRQTAETARQKGFDGWDVARKADTKMAAGAYLTWSLPGDCERAAVAISGHPELFKEMQTEEEARIITDTLKPSAERTQLDVFTPTKTEADVVADDAEAVSANSRYTAKKAAPKGNWAQGLMGKLGWGKKDDDAAE